MGPITITRSITVGGRFGTLKGTKLHKYAAEGNLAGIQTLLDEHKGSNLTSERMRWPMHWDSDRKYIDTTATYTINGKQRQTNALDIALAFGHSKIVKFLINNGASFTYALCLAEKKLTITSEGLNRLLGNQSLSPYITAREARVEGPVELMRCLYPNGNHKMLDVLFNADPKLPLNFKLHLKFSNNHTQVYTLPIQFYTLLFSSFSGLNILANNLQLDMNGRGLAATDSGGSSSPEQEGLTAIECMVYTSMAPGSILKYIDKFIVPNKISTEEINLLLRIGNLALTEYIFDNKLCEMSLLSTAVDSMLQAKPQPQGVIRFLKQHRLTLTNNQIMHALKWNNIEINDYLLSEQSRGVKECVPYLIVSLAELGITNSFRFVVTNLIDFDYLNLQFKWSSFVQKPTYAVECVNAVQGLFQDPSQDLERYNSYLKEALDYQLFKQTDTPLTDAVSQHLRDLGYTDQQIDPIFKGELLPLLAADIQDVSKPITYAMDELSDELVNLELSDQYGTNQTAARQASKF